MTKNTKLIPKGDYCYSDAGNCPYYKIIKARPEKLNGFCGYIGKGDLELAKERMKHDWIVIIRGKNKKMTKANKLVFYGSGAMSLLWDQVKEQCPVK